MAEASIKGLGEIRVDDIAAPEALALLHDLTGLLGRGVNRLPAILFGLSGDKEGEGGQVAQLAFLNAIVDIAANSSSTGTVAVVRRVVSCCEIMQPSGTWRKLDLEGDFRASNLSAMMEVVRFALEVTYRDFFSGRGEFGLQSILRSFRPIN